MSQNMTHVGSVNYVWLTTSQKEKGKHKYVQRKAYVNNKKRNRKIYHVFNQSKRPLKKKYMQGKNEKNRNNC